MRLVLLGLCLLLAAPAGAQTPMGVQPGRAGEDRVVVAIFGGLLGRAIRENVALWARPLGVQTVFVEGSSGDLLAKLRAQRGAPQFDVALLNDQSFVIARNMGLIDKPDPAVVTNLATLRAGFGRADGFGVPYEVNPVGWGYRRDKLTEAGVPPPVRWRDVLDPRLAGRVLTFPPSLIYGPLQAAAMVLSAGGTLRADDTAYWTFLDQMKAGRTVVASTPGQAEDLAKSGEVWVFPAIAQRVQLLRNQGVDVGFAPPVDARMTQINYATPVRGAPHPVNAQRLVNWFIGPEIQGRLAAEAAVVPVNAGVPVSPAMKERMGFAGDADLPRFEALDVDAVLERFDGWLERFGRLMAR